MNESNQIQTETLTEKLNRDTARIAWSALENHYQEGSVIAVDDSLDLIEVAANFSLDNTEKVKAWLTAALVARVSEEKAQKWRESDQQVWAVVVAPWVLVQDRKPGDKRG